MGALWEDIKCDFKHFSDREHVALLGDKKWEHGMAVFCKPFTTAKVRYFDEHRADQGSEWIHAELSHTSASVQNPPPHIARGPFGPEGVQGLIHWIANENGYRRSANGTRGANRCGARLGRRGGVPRAFPVLMKQYV